MQTKGEFTPGPWGCHATVSAPDFPPRFQITAPGITVALVHSGQRDFDHANARLIAASPTLYDFAKRKADSGDEEAARIVEAIDASQHRSKDNADEG